MRNFGMLAGSALLALSAVGCGAGALVEAGHRGLLFDPKAGGLKPEVLKPGYYTLETCGMFCRGPGQHVDDFDISYSTQKEEIETNSTEGLPMTLRVAVIYRPIESELYQLDTEIGPKYYDEVIGPEFRSAARGVFARHSYTELQKKNSEIEDEIEAELRKRTKGKHVEIASVTMESITYAPQIAEAIQSKLVGEQEALRQKTALEADALRKKVEIEAQAEQQKLKQEAELREMDMQKKLTEQQAAIDKMKAETAASIEVTQAKADAEASKSLAIAEKAKSQAITPLEVQMHAYDALARLGGTGTTILLGDWSHVPNFLFPGGVFGAGLPQMAKASSNLPAEYQPKAATPTSAKLPMPGKNALPAKVSDDVIE